MWVVIRILFWPAFVGLTIPFVLAVTPDRNKQIALAWVLGVIAIKLFPAGAIREAISHRPRTKSQWMVATQHHLGQLGRLLLILAPSIVGITLVVTTDFNNENTETMIGYGGLLVSGFVYCVIYEGTYVNKGRGRL